MPATDRSSGRLRDAVFECLAQRERRRVVEVLGQRGASSLEELAAAVSDGGERAGSRTDRLELALHHRHLPKLADAGIVEYDPEAGVVEPTERTDAVDAVAQTVDRCRALSAADREEGERARLD